jgi:hypothetical protein
VYIVGGADEGSAGWAIWQRGNPLPLNDAYLMPVSVRYILKGSRYDVYRSPVPDRFIGKSIACEYAKSRTGE